MELEDAEPLTTIHQSIRGETAHSLDECIQMEPQHINTPDDVGYAPLHWAIWKEDMVAFQTLIKASANIDQQTSHRRETPLHFACTNLNVGMVRILLDLGASISSLDIAKWTPLHDAVNSIRNQQQHMDMVQMLLDAHADPNCRDAEEATPLHLLFRNEHVDLDHMAAMARALMNAGADLEAKTRFGRTVLLYACLDQCRNVPILIDLGANIKAVDGDGENLLSHLFRNEDDLEPSLLDPKLLVGVNADARNIHNEIPLDFLAERVRDSIMWQPLTIRLVVDMVDLILGTREANWEEGLFLDNKQELEADGSHARLRHWVMRQRQLMQRDDSWGDYDCEEDDLLGWYEDEYNESSSSDTDDDEHHLSDDSDSGDLETMSKRDEEEQENDDDGDDDEESIHFHDAHETWE
ncbi:hypothetical protein CEP54_015736 [Fusarium duplospermum]|uniref:Uncharacterized protein n=1 Tax=Fusarium duplospermum TaxID=1325734 RepID=A0A428NLR4_9HYPO|nr:hypothetical protein CEP54_015736 [Fusarium duplospermum]